MQAVGGVGVKDAIAIQLAISSQEKLKATGIAVNKSLVVNDIFAVQIRNVIRRTIS